MVKRVLPSIYFVLDCGRAWGGDLHCSGLRAEGGRGEAAEPRPGERHRPHDVRR